MPSSSVREDLMTLPQLKIFNYSHRSSTKHFISLGRKCDSLLVCIKAFCCASGFKLHPVWESVAFSPQ